MDTRTTDIVTKLMEELATIEEKKASICKKYNGMANAGAVGDGQKAEDIVALRELQTQAKTLKQRVSLAINFMRDYARQTS